MNLSELNHFLAGRTSVRQYLPEPVPDKVIWEILKATNKAPSAGNLESWDVIVVTDEGTRELLSDAAFLQEHVSAAPVVFVICANYVRSMSRYDERGILYAMQDATIAGIPDAGAHAAGLDHADRAFDDEWSGSEASRTYKTDYLPPDIGGTAPTTMDTGVCVHYGYW